LHFQYLSEKERLKDSKCNFNGHQLDLITFFDSAIRQHSTRFHDVFIFVHRRAFFDDNRQQGNENLRPRRLEESDARFRRRERFKNKNTFPL